ncbi:MAG: UPF0149 family protein [Pseudomonadota bacterium]
MNLFAPLSDEELDLLDEFLLDRIDEDEVYEDGLEKDEGILNVSELDGFLTAIVSGPETILPSRWLPAVWGEYAPDWKDDEAFMSVFSLLIRHMNGIANTLLEQPEDFEPLFNERVVDGKTYVIVDDWCEGYVKGVNLMAGSWEDAGAGMELLLMPILAFTGVTDWKGHELPSDAEAGNLHEAIRRNVREIHAYWLARRGNALPAGQPVRHETPVPGRNDPCPCGSGKKYKKCCLH